MSTTIFRRQLNLPETVAMSVALRIAVAAAAAALAAPRQAWWRVAARVPRPKLQSVARRLRTAASARTAWRLQAPGSSLQRPAAAAATAAAAAAVPQQGL